MLKQQIQADVTDAMKSGDRDRSATLRLALAAIGAKEKEKRYKEKLDADARLTDDETVLVLVSEIKKRKDAIALYEQGGRPELAAKEKAEIEIFKKYLPEQLSPEELKKIIEESIKKTGAKEMKDMGKIMADLMPRVKGKAEGSEISKIIKELMDN